MGRVDEFGYGGAFPILRAARADVDLRASAEKIKAAPSKALSFCLTDKACARG